MKPLVYVIIPLNILFVLWIMFNGLDEGWKGTPAQIASATMLVTLLLANSLLLFIYHRRQK